MHNTISTAWSRGSKKASELYQKLRLIKRHVVLEMKKQRVTVLIHINSDLDTGTDLWTCTLALIQTSTLLKATPTQHGPNLYSNLDTQTHCSPTYALLTHARTHAHVHTLRHSSTPILIRNILNPGTETAKGIFILISFSRRRNAETTQPLS